MKASKPQIVELAAQVIENQIAYDNACKAYNEQRTLDKGERYLATLISSIYRLKWIIERDNKPLAKRFKDAQQ